MTGLPLRFVHENVLVGHGESRAALYRVATISYPFMAAADKREWLGRLARFAFAVQADFSLWRVNRAYPAECYVEQAEAMLDERRQSLEAWRSYLQGHEHHLRRLRSFVPEVYLAVSLQADRGSGLGAGVLRGMDRVRRRVEALAGVGAAAPIAVSELEALIAGEERAFARAAACLSVRRATTTEVQWLLRRAACRGLGEPALDAHWRPAAVMVETTDGRLAYEPLETDLVRHANAPILEEDRALVVDSREGRSHQALLAVGALPDEAEFPGSAELLCSPLEAVDFPVDSVLHAHWIGNREAFTRVRRRIVDADNAFAEQLTSAHGPLSFQAEENRQLARELDAYLQSHERPPLLRAAISLAVGAASREELERRVEALTHHFGTVTVHRPLGLQPALFLDHLPRADGGRVGDYADVLTIEQFGALMAIGTHGAGAERGVFIGRTATGGLRPVKFDITEASRTGRLEGLPELSGRVHVIELSGAERYRGLLDPLVVAPEALREDLASSYLMELLPQAPAPWETQIRKAVRDALRSAHPSCLRVLDALQRSADPDARAAGEAWRCGLTPGSAGSRSARARRRAWRRGCR